MMVYGAVLSSDLDDEAKVEIDASALNTLQFDSSKLMDTIEINIKTGKALLIQTVVRFQILSHMILKQKQVIMQ